MALKLDNIGKRYGRHTALSEVSLHVRKGDCYGFLGHNGAGKTTALRIALGLIRPDGGRVIVDGFDAARHPREARARQGGLIETPGFYPWMTGRRNLRLLAGPSGLTRAEGRAEADRLLEVVGLSSSGDRAVGGYSQGMRQRLGIAQALLGDPELVLLDEPMNGLDPEGIEEFRRLILGLVTEHGKTVVLSSHQLHEVAGICNRIGILRRGRVVAEAETKALLEGAGRKYVLRTGDDALAEKVLREAGLDLSARPEGGFEFDPGRIDPALIAKPLVTGDVPIVELAPKAASLEEIYLRLSREDDASLVPPPADLAPAQPPRERRAPRFPLLRAAAADLKRTFSHYGPVLALLLPALLAGLSIMRQWAKAAGHLEAVEAGAVATTTQVTAFLSSVIALMSALPVAALVLAGIGSQSLAGELSRGTLRNLLLRPLGRRSLALGKAASLTATSLLTFAMLVLVAVGGSAIAFNFTDVVEILEIDLAEPYVFVTAEELWPPYLWMVPALFLPTAAYACLGFLAGALTKRSATALALAIGFVAFLDLARTTGREFGFEPWLLSAHMPSPLGDTSLAQHLYDRIENVNDVPRGYGMLSVWVPLVWAAVSVTLATLVLRRRSVS